MQGALQLMVRITGTKNNEIIHLDDVFVLGQDIAVGDGFRRITYLSQKQIAIVGVNVRVECTTAESNCSSSQISATTEVPETDSTSAMISTTESTSTGLGISTTTTEGTVNS